MNDTYDGYAQRPIPAVRYLDHPANTRPEGKGLKPQDFIVSSILKEIEDSGLVKNLTATESSRAYRAQARPARTGDSSPLFGRLCAPAVIA